VIFQDTFLKDNIERPGKRILRIAILEITFTFPVSGVVPKSLAGKIFTKDTLESKEVEIWHGPIDSGGKIRAELRYTEGAAVYPMAGLLFTRLN